jgi:arylsulfatase A
LGALLGEKGAKGRAHLVQQDNGRGGNYGYRVGNWKLQRHDSERMYNGNLQMEAWTVPQYTLFNLAEDIREMNDVYEKFPEVAIRMKNQLQSIIDNGYTRK